MRRASAFAVTVAALFGFAPGLAPKAQAKPLSEAGSPVNLPPADFEGRSFVDNDGCIYIRAGVDGAVSWVPRVTRSREVICGQEPTFGPPVVAAAPAPVTRPAVPVASAAPAPVATPVRRAPVTIETRRTNPAVAANDCAQVPDASRPFLNEDGVRCGPQVESPSSGISQVASGDGAGGLGGGGFTPQVIPVVPPAPEGYRAAWTDDRLNPLRGLPEQRARTAPPGTPKATKVGPYILTWTTTTPRRLYDARTGALMGAKFPELVFPNTNPNAVRRPAVTVSTKSAPALTQPRASTLAKPRIQVATFADVEAARAAAQRLANTGIRTRIGHYTAQSGQKRQVILLGPFETQAALNRALGTAQNQGFAGAFARK